MTITNGIIKCTKIEIFSILDRIGEVIKCIRLESLKTITQFDNLLDGFNDRGQFDGIDVIRIDRFAKLRDTFTKRLNLLGEVAQILITKDLGAKASIGQITFHFDQSLDGLDHAVDFVKIDVFVRCSIGEFGNTLAQFLEILTEIAKILVAEEEALKASRLLHAVLNIDQLLQSRNGSFNRSSIHPSNLLRVSLNGTTKIDHASGQTGPVLRACDGLPQSANGGKGVLHLDKRFESWHRRLDGLGIKTVDFIAKLFDCSAESNHASG